MLNLEFYVTQINIHLNKIYEGTKLILVDELSNQMINHNIVTFRRLINHRCSNDVFTNDNCSNLVRFKSAVNLLEFVNEMKYATGLKDIVFNDLVIYTFKRCGLYRLISDDIYKNIFV